MTFFHSNNFIVQCVFKSFKVYYLATGELFSRWRCRDSRRLLPACAKVVSLCGILITLISPAHCLCHMLYHMATTGLRTLTSRSIILASHKASALSQTKTLALNHKSSVHLIWKSTVWCKSLRPEQQLLNTFFFYYLNITNFRNKTNKQDKQCE